MARNQETGAALVVGAEIKKGDAPDPGPKIVSTSATRTKKEVAARTEIATGIVNENAVVVKIAGEAEAGTGTTGEVAVVTAATVTGDQDHGRRREGKDDLHLALEVVEGLAEIPLPQERNPLQMST